MLARIARNRLLPDRGFSRLHASTGSKSVRVRILQYCFFFLNPPGSPGLFQLPGENFIDLTQMGDVGEGVFQLPF